MPRIQKDQPPRHWFIRLARLHMPNCVYAETARTAVTVMEKALKAGSMHLSNESIIVVLAVGPVAGWLAGRIVRGAGFSLIGDIARSSARSSATGCCLA